MDPVVIIGCTGAGKTKLSLEIARQFGGEIVSADSMQVYHGLDVLTNKATPVERAQVPHHMLDITSPLTPMTVHQYAKSALAAIAEIQARGNLPVVVGGTYYYVESLLYCDATADPEEHTTSVSLVSTKEHADAASVDDVADETLWEQLHRVDPARAAMLHPNDERKILRSLQVYHQKHERHSNLLDQRIPRFAKCCVLWVHCDLTVLDTRLDQRVDEMVATGLLQELRAFYAHLDQDPPPLLTTDDMGLDYTKGVLQAIGVKEFKLLLSTGGKAAAADEVVAKRPCHSGGGSPLNQDEKEDAETQLCLEKMKQATRRYARRQLLWVRRRFLIRPRSLQTRQYAVFRLDSTAPQQWEQLVRQPAMEMVSAFMKASDVWPPAAMAAHRVDLEEKDADPPVPIAKHYTCPDCKNRLFVGEHQWQAHLHSRGHRKRCQGNSKRRGEASKGASASTS